MLWVTRHIDNYACFHAQNMKSSDLNPSDLAFDLQDNKAGKKIPKAVIDYCFIKGLVQNHNRIFPGSGNVYGIMYFNCRLSTIGKKQTKPFFFT